MEVDSSWSQQERMKIKSTMTSGEATKLSKEISDGKHNIKIEIIILYYL